ncbi:hypothetical protein [Nocardioides mesophilus]|uniref:Altered inheritance of mitochondria protein 6 n=1 Tax=Nocardioides mesophilus TaxID=433659 RepID=A0A7G9RB29_9ACTN|nr:hypothetical protein [Nocardioides mesophilus]QNN52804.1 hypothetical protein H9L09_20655 [Nocardioides mesophilus]
MRIRILLCAVALSTSTVLDLMAVPPVTLPTNCAAVTVGGVPDGHAHNDYLHPHPLTDALAAGFDSVEADIWPVAGRLLVGHTRDQTRPGRTLTSLYLEPLRRRVSAAQADGRTLAPVQLLLDVKGDPHQTLGLLDPLLAAYTEILTGYRGCVATPGPVSVVLSGNETPQPPARDQVRYYGYDVALGRFDDRHLDEAVAPLASARWRTFFAWNGLGRMPGPQRARLDKLVAAVHAAGTRLRLYGAPQPTAPDAENLWAVLTEAGVDYINTDDLTGFARYRDRQR